MTLATVPDATVASFEIDKTKILASLGLDPRKPETHALMLVCERYNLDPVLKHLVLIKDKPYITRDGYLEVAHQSGQLDGIEVVDQGVTDAEWWAKVSVYRKDMSRPFTYIGRYPKKDAGHMAKFGPEMAIKVGEVMALRRAFSVTGVGASDEQWDAIDVTEASEPTPDQLMASAEAHTRLGELIGELGPEAKATLAAWWKEQRYPAIQHGMLTVGQIAEISSKIIEVAAGKDDPDPDGPGTGSAPDEQGVSDALVGDPEHATGDGAEGEAGSGTPADDASAPDPATSSQVEQPAANGGAGVVDPPAPTRPRGAQIDVFKIAGRVFTINGNAKGKREHAEKMRHRLTGVLTQGRTESTSDLSDDELKGLVEAMVAIERGELEMVQSANQGGAWQLRRRPGSKRSAA